MPADELLPTVAGPAGLRLDADPIARAMDALRCAAAHGAADEAPATIDRASGDVDAWVDELMAVAGSAWAAARSAEAEGRRAGALARHRQAMSYYAAALTLIPFGTEPQREDAVWRRQRACWERTVDLMRVPGERLAIPFEGRRLRGYFFPAPDSGPGEVRPLIVVNHGGEDPTSGTWARVGAAAAERGHHWMTFDGPGQQAALIEQRLLLRPDWEAVLSPVVDAVGARADVDRSRMAVYGIGRGGLLVARALAFEHRFTAAVVDRAVVDFAAAWLSSLSAEQRERLVRREQGAFDRVHHLAELSDPSLTARYRVAAAPLGLADGSRFRFYTALSAYRSGDVLERLRTPLLVVPSGDGADQAFDWLDARLAGAGATSP